MKAAVYSGTYNLYPYMLTAAKSLIIHSDVDRIYFLIEDDEFPFDLPPQIECINISGQKYFTAETCINWKTRFTYMAMIRGALAYVFPNLDRILSFDVDTIVDKDVSDIWDLPIDDYYLAASYEPKPYKTQDYAYYNTGVALFNLQKLRDGKTDEIIKAINEKKYTLPEQDALNELCRGKIYDMDSKYNANPYTRPTDDPHIIHYAGLTDWYDMPEVERYSKIPINELNNAKKSAVSNYKRNRYMIHGTPEREWYVNEFLVPSMIEQGIPEEDIVLWIDNEHKGNLESFMQSCRWIGESQSYLGGFWHLQDDVVISKTFAKRAEENGNGIVCGFCTPAFEGGNVNLIGVQPIAFMWFSFQCIRIPNIYAKQCADWFYNVAKPQKIFRDYWAEGKHDDVMFRKFMQDNYPKEMVHNLMSNMVDHVDYLVGGTLINKHRLGEKRTAYWWREDDTVKELEDKLRERGYSV